MGELKFKPRQFASRFPLFHTTPNLQNVGQGNLVKKKKLKGRTSDYPPTSPSGAEISLGVMNRRKNNKEQK